MRLGCIDVGSNTLLLLVVDVGRDGQLSVVRDECRFGRLGQGLDQSQKLADAAVARSLEIIGEFRCILDEVGVDHVFAVGTEALRKASNAAAFLTPAAATLGGDIEVIGGKREAELVFGAVVQSFPALSAQTFVTADVGGASTEIIVGQGASIQSMVSVPIGAVRLSERHLHNDPATRDEARALVADIDSVLAPLQLPSGAALVGTAGTATSLASVELKLRRYDAERVNGFRLAPASIDRLVARFLELTVADKRRLVGLEPARADVIAGGAAIYARLANRVSAPEMLVSDRGLRWGLAHEKAAALTG